MIITDHPISQVTTDTRRETAHGASGPDHSCTASHADPVGVAHGPSGPDHEVLVSQAHLVGAAHTPADGPLLADPLLAMAADVLEDLQQLRIGNENRLRQLTRDVDDADGVNRGFGLSLEHPDVARLAGIVDALAQQEHAAELNLQRIMRKHPLNAWVSTVPGVGSKTVARLLGKIGDPYWNTLHHRPRTVSELWAYCGLHTLPATHSPPDPQSGPGGGGSTGGDPGHGWVAARKQKGIRANWSNDAKKYVYLIAVNCMKQTGGGSGDASPYRGTYDRRREATQGRLHAAACVRCGPSGRPALPGSEWSKAHQHADALRITGKAVLKDLYIAARDHHAREAVT